MVLKSIVQCIVSVYTEIEIENHGCNFVLTYSNSLHGLYNEQETNGSFQVTFDHQ